jgi:hypothetical protein
MANLHDLYAAVDALRQSGKSGKVGFYFVGDLDQKLHSGHLLVRQGNACAVSCLDLDGEAALRMIPGLRLSKVSTLPVLEVAPTQPGGMLTIAAVLAQLDPAMHPARDPVPVEPGYERVTAKSRLTAPEPSPAPAKAPHVFYSHVQMQKDATELLEALYGRAAEKKVEEFAHSSPPHQYPKDFLQKCVQHAAMMLGNKKAEELFAPLFAKSGH